jgi:cytochrome c oxidase subunit II
VSGPGTTAAALAGLRLPPDASSEGWRVDQLFASTHVLVGIVAVVAFGALAAAVWRFRAADAARYSHGTSRRAIAVPLAAAAFVLLVIDGNLFLTSARDLEVLGAAGERAEEPDAVRMQITARQWSWEVRYPGPDGVFGTERDVVVTDRLRIPKGRPVVVQLASVDVVHALNLPSFRVKLQAIPGRINMVWFEAAELGRFEIACAQHCGPFHYKMRGEIEVVADEDFEAWIAREAADAVRTQRERERAEAEEVRSELRWPTWEPEPLTGAWAWEDGLRGDGAPEREHEHHGHEHGGAR